MTAMCLLISNFADLCETPPGPCHTEALGLTQTHHILQLSSGRAERVGDRGLHVLMPALDGRLAAHRNVGSAGKRQVQSDGAEIAGSMTMLRPRNHHPG